ncbi:GAF domain-containing protein [Shewanella alkalitolerans]|uniref:GAF domain-containing protein n=1 Tax=Shewanella alkalitolerans TaxID=2864209 RepID=UPI001C65C811|nr:GAF domain-containing protein [Shewanella alkalitolerans]QYJ98124.1 GAF domain-containing protein [Shewanella alkalitolerans]
MSLEKENKIISKLNNIVMILNRAVTTWNNLVLPLLIGVFLAYILDKKTKVDEIPTFVWIIVSIFIMIQFFVAIIQHKGSSFDTMIMEYRDKNAALTNIKNEFENLKTQYTKDSTCFYSQRTALRNAVNSLSYSIGLIRNVEAADREVTEEEFDTMLDSLVRPLHIFREKLFSLEAETLWNIAIYLPEIENNDELVSVWRRHDDRIVPKNRTWKPGIGVVGESFVYKSIKYYEDISKIANNSGHNSRWDIETYKSIIAIPIVPCIDGSSEDDHKPLGVLIMTSSAAEQFNLDRDAHFLQTYANLIAILVEKLQTYFDHTDNTAQGGT